MAIIQLEFTSYSSQSLVYKKNPEAVGLRIQLGSKINAESKRPTFIKAMTKDAIDAFFPSLLLQAWRRKRVGFDWSSPKQANPWISSWQKSSCFPRHFQSLESSLAQLRLASKALFFVVAMSEYLVLARLPFTASVVVGMDVALISVVTWNAESMISPSRRGWIPWFLTRNEWYAWGRGE